MKTIVLQLKSTQQEANLEDISSIIELIYHKYNYKIKGHEIQQLDSIIKKTTLPERVNMVSKFCSLNELDYLTYHTRIFENGENIWDEKWNAQIRDSILLTIEEADKVQREAGVKNKAIVVFHLTNFVPRVRLPALTREEKFQMIEKTEHAFLNILHNDDFDNGDEQVKNSENDSYYYAKNNKERNCLGKSTIMISSLAEVILAVENSYPKLYPNHAITSPFHPIEIARLAKYGIKTVFDLSHYHLYSTYLLSGSGNLNGDLDRQIYGRNAPDWKEAADILTSSVVQLHISDARGFTSQGEGLPLGDGQIDLQYALTSFDKAIYNKKKTTGEDSSMRIIRGTIELNNGHLDHSKTQQKSAEWLLENIPQVLL